MAPPSFNAPSDLIASLAAKYMWWPALGASGHSEDRIIAQVMDIGSYEDILRIEAALGRGRLAEVMHRAAPGWISARSWEFWRGRLKARAGLDVPERPPRRTFYAAASQTHAAQIKVSFFDGIPIERTSASSLGQDGVLLVASSEDLLATKLKVILDRAEVKDYVDIAALLRAGVSLERSLAGFAQMFEGEPATVLRAIGYFDDGDVHELGSGDREVLTKARDNLGPLPKLSIRRGSLAGG